MIRADVKIRQRDPESDDGYAFEWGHEQDLELDELGVKVTWDYGCFVFLPWASVVRIHDGPCSCLECKPPKASA